MPTAIPRLKDMYDKEPFHEFVNLMYWYYNGNRNLAQRRWSKLLAAEIAHYRGLYSPQEVLRMFVDYENVRLMNCYKSKKRYKRWWER